MRALLPAAVVLLALAGCGGQPAGAPDSTPSASSPAAVRGTVSGTVRTADGRPLAGASVLPRSLDHPAQPVPEMVVVTDRQGTFSWSLPPGRYELTVHDAAGTRLAAKEVTVVAGRTATLDW
jgi:hypothetical protein